MLTLSFRRLWRVPVLAALALFALAGSSCNTKGEPPKYFIQFYMETPTQSGLAFSLPESGLQYYRQPQPFLTARDVLWIQPGSVDVAGTRTICVFFQFNVQGTHQLDIVTSENVGRKIFLFANDKPIGVRYVDQSIHNGQLFVIVEAADAKKFEELVKDLQDSQQQVLALKKKL